MSRFGDDYYEFRKKVMKGRQANNIAHASVISPAELNNQYYGDLVDEHKLIHSNRPYIPIQKNDVIKHDMGDQYGNPNYIPQNPRQTHKYITISNGRYIYQEDLDRQKRVEEAGRQRDQYLRDQEQQKRENELKRQQAAQQAQQAQRQNNQLGGDAEKLSERARNGDYVGAARDVANNAKVKDYINKVGDAFRNKSARIENGKIVGHESMGKDIEDWINSIVRNSGHNAAATKNEITKAIKAEIEKQYKAATSGGGASQAAREAAQRNRYENSTDEDKYRQSQAQKQKQAELNEKMEIYKNQQEQERESERQKEEAERHKNETGGTQSYADEQKAKERDRYERINQLKKDAQSTDRNKAEAAAKELESYTHERENAENTRKAEEAKREKEEIAKELEERKRSIEADSGKLTRKEFEDKYNMSYDYLEEVYGVDYNSAKEEKEREQAKKKREAMKKNKGNIYHSVIFPNESKIISDFKAFRRRAKAGEEMNSLTHSCRWDNKKRKSLKHEDIAFIETIKGKNSKEVIATVMDSDRINDYLDAVEECYRENQDIRHPNVETLERLNAEDNAIEGWLAEITSLSNNPNLLKQLKSALQEKLDKIDMRYRG